MTQSIRVLILILASNFVLLLAAYGQGSTAEVRSLIQNSWSYLNKNADSTIYFSELAFTEASKNQDYWAMSKSLSYSGYARERLGWADKAVVDYFEALRWAVKADTADHFSTFTLTRNIAAIQRSFMNYEQAIVYYDSALHYLNEHLKTYPKQALKYNDQNLQYDTEYYMASSARELKVPGKAVPILKRLSEDEQVPKSVALKALINLGLISRDLKDFETAKGFFRQVIVKAEFDTVSKWRGQHGLALIEFQQQHHNEAIRLYSTAIETITPYKNPGEHLFTSYIDIGESFLEIEDFENSWKYLNMALNFWNSERIDREPDYYHLYHLLARVSVRMKPVQTDHWIVKFEQCSNSFIEIQQSLRNEQANRAFNAHLKAYLADLEHNEEITGLEKWYNARLLFILTVSLATSYLGIQIWRIRKKKKIFKMAQHAVRPNRPKLS